jgi:formylglycine-generating enzyme required for sulfatase activity
VSAWRNKPLPVDSFSPNPWGLYNVHGNVREWVQDCYFGNLSSERVDGSARPATTCKDRVQKGGSWYDHPALMRSAARGIAPPEERRDIVGVRIARDLGSVPEASSEKNPFDYDDDAVVSGPSKRSKK